MGVTTERAREAAKHSPRYATYTDPKRESVAGKVLRAIKEHPGCPAWAIARNAHVPLKYVWDALAHLRSRRKIFKHRSEYRTPDGTAERVYVTWWPGAAPASVTPVDSMRCQTPLGFARVCGTRLAERTDAIGRVTFACPACERRNRGVCRTCPRPTASEKTTGPKPWYCPACELENRRRRAREKYRAEHNVQPEAMRV